MWKTTYKKIWQKLCRILKKTQTWHVILEECKSLLSFCHVSLNVNQEISYFSQYYMLCATVLTIWNVTASIVVLSEQIVLVITHYFTDIRVALLELSLLQTLSILSVDTGRSLLMVSIWIVCSSTVVYNTFSKNTPKEEINLKLF